MQAWKNNLRVLWRRFPQAVIGTLWSLGQTISPLGLLSQLTDAAEFIMMHCYPRLRLSLFLFHYRVACGLNDWTNIQETLHTCIEGWTITISGLLVNLCRSRTDKYSPTGSILQIWCWHSMCSLFVGTASYRPSVNKSQSQSLKLLHHT